MRIVLAAIRRLVDEKTWNVLTRGAVEWCGGRWKPGPRERARDTERRRLRRGRERKLQSHMIDSWQSSPFSTRKDGQPDAGYSAASGRREARRGEGLGCQETWVRSSASRAEIFRRERKKNTCSRRGAPTAFADCNLSITTLALFLRLMSRATIFWRFFQGRGTRGEISSICALRWLMKLHFAVRLVLANLRAICLCYH